jgi:homocysteine S-methyltransferase
MTGRNSAQPILILDGGLGTTLEEEHGVQFSSTSTPLWSSHLLLSSPDTLRKTHAEFVEAGADIVLTATYQASVDGFRRTPKLRPGDANDGKADNGLTCDSKDAAHYMRSAVSIARSAFNAAGRPGSVALSLGPYGATMVPSQEYTGQYPAHMRTRAGLATFHLDRLSCFAEDEKVWEDIDLVAFETLPVLTEVEAVRLAMDELERKDGRRKRFWISCVFPNDDDCIPDHSTVASVVEAMLST